MRNGLELALIIFTRVISVELTTHLRHARLWDKTCLQF